MRRKDGAWMRHLGSYRNPRLKLADFDDVGGGGCGGIGSFHQFLCYGEELRGLRALGSGESYGQAAIATFADGGDEFDGTEEWDLKLGRGALGAALGEDVDDLMAVRAREVAHVLDDSEDFDVDLG